MSYISKHGKRRVGADSRPKAKGRLKVGAGFEELNWSKSGINEKSRINKNMFRTVNFINII